MQPVYPCPTCQERTITMWRNFQATRRLPAFCPQCRGRSDVSAWAHLGTHFGAEMLIPAPLIVALVLKSWWGLLFFPVGLIAMAALVGIAFPLRGEERSS